MITTILFDLDGTLLPMDQEQFIEAYLTKMAEKMASYGYEPKLLAKAVWAGTGAMVQNNGSNINDQVFWDTFCTVCGKDARVDEPIFQDFYRNEFQQVRHACGFDPRVNPFIQELKARGFRTILATNPLFPAIATHSRIRWAGLQPEDFEYITTYENSCHCKPNLAYYQEILEKLNLTPEQCLMVGNDVAEDMVVRKLGMDAFLLTDCLINKHHEDISSLAHGSFPELLDYLWRI